MKKVGLTTTIPVEVIFAAKHIPVDINNIFILNEKEGEMVEKAEIDGFPRNLCSWIKARYTVALQSNLDVLIGVHEGDCSNTKVLMEILEHQKIKVYDFSYPKSKNIEDIKKEIQKLMDFLNVNEKEVNVVKERLYPIRQKIKELDELTYKTDQATGFENHLYQVCCSDFNGDYNDFEKELEKKIKEIKERKPHHTKLRLGYIGVPPIFSDLYEVVEEHEGKIMFNEVQRQFSFSAFDKDTSIERMVQQYTYPYDLKGRIKDIKREIEKRKLDGILHYTQAFCYRAMEDIVIKKELDIPILTIEGDKKGKVDSRTKIRIEAFMDMLKDLK